MTHLLNNKLVTLLLSTLMAFTLLAGSISITGCAAQDNTTNEQDDCYGDDLPATKD